MNLPTFIQQREGECKCKEMSCPSDCSRDHTHKTFSCEKCTSVPQKESEHDPKNEECPRYEHYDCPEHEVYPCTCKTPPEGDKERFVQLLHKAVSPLPAQGNWEEEFDELMPKKATHKKGEWISVDTTKEGTHFVMSIEQRDNLKSFIRTLLSHTANEAEERGFAKGYEGKHIDHTRESIEAQAYKRGKADENTRLLNQRANQHDNEVRSSTLARVREEIEEQLANAEEFGYEDRKKYPEFTGTAVLTDLLALLDNIERE